eukprot:CAMPEP_0119273374 /NCGR_PEP_ID=MMETSP1329-20130426/10148_1 /TAXON_ID=114041 /ORGANISM="Genus nov. species nov., Strain RCC1024" /LENGTH=226 /DNA_ID=CAMNT_0007273573 /DNA_START=137 /DNA_END=814 /DNA_ORIENTATION=+
MLARAVYRAALRASSAVRRSGHPLLLMPPVTSDEWGSSRHLKPVEAARDRDARRNELFPWAATEDSAETAGALSGDELRELARRTFRAPVEDEDLALDDALAALRSLNSLMVTHQGASVQVTEGVRVIAMASWLGVTAKGHNVFAYRMRIANTRPDEIQLKSRHWVISGDDEDIVVPRGSPGVVGKTPKFEPGAEFEYASGTELMAGDGSVRGAFEFVKLGSQPEE